MCVAAAAVDVRGGSGGKCACAAVRTTIRNTYLLLCGPRSASRARTMIRTTGVAREDGGRAAVSGEVLPAM